MATATKPTPTKKKATPRKRTLIPPFKSPSRQNVVCELMFAGHTRKQIKAELPAILLKRGLGVSESVESLITTTITGLTKYKLWTVVRGDNGAYKCKPPVKSKK